MKAILELTEERVKVHIERQKTLITAMQNEYNNLKNNKRLIEVSFPELEKEYIDWKKELEAKKAAIADEQEELDILVHFDKFKHTPKPSLVQQQVVQKKKKFKNTDVVPLPQIKWKDVIVPILKNAGKFLTPNQIWKEIVDTQVLDNDIKNKRRLTVTVSSKSKFCRNYNVNGNSYIGLPDWFDEEGVPKQEFLNNFIGTKTA